MIICRIHYFVFTYFLIALLETLSYTNHNCGILLYFLIDFFQCAMYNGVRLNNNSHKEDSHYEKDAE